MSFEKLNQIVVACRECPRLVQYRETHPKRALYKDEEYWRRPVPGFGDKDASLLLLGLAPSPHGGNRTGRVFTGDESGNFLFKCLYKSGFANQREGLHREDGLKLINCYITALVKCVPPKHRPTPQETLNCSPYFEEEFRLLKRLKNVLAMGGFAFNGYLHFLKKNGVKLSKKIPFSHGLKIEIEGWPTLWASYHPSPQNTFTGILTEKMMVDLLVRIKRC